MRKVKCADPNCPHERIRYFKDWCKEKLPGSDKGLLIYDIDLVVFSRNTGKILVFETKSNMAYPSFGQKLFLSNVNNWFSNGTSGPKWSFQGVHLVQFEKYRFDDGRCYFDQKQITEEEMIQMIKEIL